MKAIRVFSRSSAVAAIVSVVLVAGCGQQVIPPSPAPAPAPKPAPIAPRPTPRTDWRSIALAPGDWSWSAADGQSMATFGQGRLSLRCDRQATTVILAIAVSATAAASAPVTIHTSSANFTRGAQLSAAGTGRLEVRFPARDPALDAMAFSRGRLALDVPGTGGFAVPSWSEIGRVIEDCR